MSTHTEGRLSVEQIRSKNNERALRASLSVKACRSVPLDELERLDVARLVEAARKLCELDWCIGYELVGANHNILHDAQQLTRAALGETDR